MIRLGVVRAAVVLASVIAFGSCGNGSEGEQTRSGAQGCAALNGMPWVPQVSGVVPSVHDPSVRVERTVYETSAPVTGLESAISPVEIRIPSASEGQQGGSLTLIAEAGVDAFPMLVSLEEPGRPGRGEAREWINVRNSGSGDCGPDGFFCCSGTECVPNSAWKLERPSAYAGRDYWEDHQINPWGPVSVNTFPTCKWESGEPGCDFPAIRPGGEFVARYAVVSAERPEGRPPSQTQLRVTLFRKYAPDQGGARARGGIDLNVILVGSANVTASRASRGKRNLNALFEHVRSRYENAANGQGIGIGTIRVIEWGCPEGGDAYAQVDVQNIGELLKTGSGILGGEGEGSSLNLFMVSTITGAAPGMTFLGLSGGIGGPAIHGTAASGLVFSSFDQLDRYNPECPDESCPVSQQEPAFIEMGETIAHEMGHFLGLNHLSESDGTQHDAIPDTPECDATERLSRGEAITIRSCLEKETACRASCPGYDGATSFCPEASACAFNHLMWWTSKNFRAGKGDGSLLSEDSLGVLRTHVTVR